MGAKQSTNTTASPSHVFQSNGSSSAATAGQHHNHSMTASSSGRSNSQRGTTATAAPTSHSSGHNSDMTSDWRQRARSLSSVLNATNGSAIHVPQMHSSLGLSVDSDSDPTASDHDLDLNPFGRVFSAHSLPVHLISFNGIKCPVCSKFVLPDDVECHLVMCLTRPRINYNEDMLTEDKGECVICLEELIKGNTIARLPCLCIYHKSCIDAWFEVNRSCPEHPSD